MKSINHEILVNNNIYINNKKIIDNKIPHNITLNIESSDNEIYINDFSGEGNLIININKERNNVSVIFGLENRITKTLVLSYVFSGKRPSEGRIQIGNHNIFNGNTFITAPGNRQAEVSIGNENLFGNNIKILSFNDHRVFDISTKVDNSKEEGILIQDRVWIGSDVILLDKSHISSNNIVGCNSLLKRKFGESFCVIAGNPAKVRRRNVMWNINFDSSITNIFNPLNL